MEIKFADLNLLPEVLRSIQELGFETPTPIQQQAIPLLLEQDIDIVGLAQTGTGKTAAFGLPLLHKVDFSIPTTQAVIICPTRELCLQITRDLENYSKFLKNVNITSVYGGANISTQIRQLRNGSQIIVATPGRLMDLMERGAARLNELQYVVLDEADEMLNMGFQQDIDTILAETPEDKNVWLFSATMPAEVLRISKKYMDNPQSITVGKRNEGASNIEHNYYVVASRDRYLVLKRVLDIYPDIFAITFCRTKQETQDIADLLIKDGYNADALHGDLSQAQRDIVMNRYRNRGVQILVATDVAARGIDVNDITHVIHYNLPDDIENYTHRSGRTARAGKSGISVSIITSKDVGKVRMIERQIQKQFTKKQVPTGAEITEAQITQYLKKVGDSEVNETELLPLMSIVEDTFGYMEKEDIIKKFISFQLNKFIEYYKQHKEIGGQNSEAGSSSNIENEQRFFINIGAMDSLDKGALIKFVCECTGLTGKDIGRIVIKDTYSFFDVNAVNKELVAAGLQGTKYSSRAVRVEAVKQAERDTSSRERRTGGDRGGYNGGGGYSGGGNRSGGGGYGGNKREDRGDRGDRGGNYSSNNSGNNRKTENYPRKMLRK